MHFRPEFNTNTWWPEVAVIILKLVFCHEFVITAVRKRTAIVTRRAWPVKAPYFRRPLFKQVLRRGTVRNWCRTRSKSSLRQSQQTMRQIRSAVHLCVIPQFGVSWWSAMIHAHSVRMFSCIRHFHSHPFLLPEPLILVLSRSLISDVGHIHF
jgi:hypothetical protein